MISAVTPLSPAQSCKAARSIERKRETSPTTRGEASAFEAFFHRGQHVAVFPGLAEDHAIRMQTDARKSGRKEIAAAQTPQHRSLHARENAGDEQSREAGILAGRSAFDRFMQMTARQTAMRQLRRR